MFDDPLGILGEQEDLDDPLGILKKKKKKKETEYDPLGILTKPSPIQPAEPITDVTGEWEEEPEEGAPEWGAKVKQFEIESGIKRLPHESEKIYHERLARSYRRSKGLPGIAPKEPQPTKKEFELTLGEKIAKFPLVKYPTEAIATVGSHIWRHGVEGTARTYEYLTSRFGENPLSNLFKSAKLDARRIADDLGKAGLEPGAITTLLNSVGIAGGAIMNIEAFGGMKRLPFTMGVGAGAEAWERGEPEGKRILALIKGGTEGFLVNKIFGAIGGMKPIPRMATTFGTFTGMGLAGGKSLDESLADGITFSVLAWSKGEKTLPELKIDIKQARETMRKLDAEKLIDPETMRKVEDLIKRTEQLPEYKSALEIKKPVEIIRDITPIERPVEPIRDITKPEPIKDITPAERPFVEKPPEPPTELPMPPEELPPKLEPKRPKRIYESLFNRFQMVENLSIEAKKKNIYIEPGEDVQFRIRELAGIGKKVKGVLEDGPYRIEKDGSVVTTGEGMMNWMQDFHSKRTTIKGYNKSEKLLGDYFKAIRIIEDLEPRHLATEKEFQWANKKLNELSTSKYQADIPLLEEILRRKNEYQHKVYKMLLDSGAISQKAYDTIIERNPNHVPFYREFPEDIYAISPRPKRAIKKPIRRIKGSERETKDVLHNIIEGTYRIVDIAEKNATGKAMIELGKLYEGLVKPAKRPIKPIELSKAEKKRYGVIDEEAILFRRKDVPLRKNEILIYENGKPKVYELDSQLYQAYSGITSTASRNLFWNLFTLPTRMLKVGATSVPDFALKNMFRDSLGAMLQTKIRFIPIVDPIRALADYVKKTPVYYEFMKVGAGMAGMVELNRKSCNMTLKEMRKKTPLMRFGNAINPLKSIKNLESFSLMLEHITRLATFKRALKKGFSPIEAGYISRESTIDFGRIGSKTQKWNECVAFFNAGMQGVEKSARVAKNNPISFTAKAIATITVPSVILFLLNKDDPLYLERPQWQRDLFWFIPGTDIRVPKPYIYGQIFGSLVERFMQYTIEKDPKAFDGLLQLIGAGVSPVGMEGIGNALPDIAKPLIENIANWNFFLKRNIVPEYKEKLISAEESRKYTPETLKEIGGQLGVSPAKLENLVLGWTGTMGRYALQGSDWLLNQIRGETKPMRPTELADIPVVRAFVSRSPLAYPETLQKFYEVKKELDEKYNTWKYYIKERDIEKAKEFKKDNPELLKSLLFDRYSKIISTINKRIDRIINSNLPEDEKRKKIEELERKRWMWAKKALAKLD